MITRRKFIQSAIAGMGATLLPAAFGKGALAMTMGSPYNPLANTWSALSEPGLWMKVWNARFSNPLPHAILYSPAGAAWNFTYKPEAGTGVTVTDPVSGVATKVPAAYTIGAGQTMWNVLGPAGSGLPQTKVWGYGNYETGMGVTFPGRSLVVRRDEPIACNWVNNLATTSVDPATGVTMVTPFPHILPVDQTFAMQSYPAGVAIDGVPTAVHHHGGDTLAEFDGGPDQWQTPVRRQVGPGITLPSQTAAGGALSYLYDNKQEASMHWYHDHAEGLTRTNAYAGLAGLYIVRDANEDALTTMPAGLAAGTSVKGKIPGGIYELPLVIQDRAFAVDGSMAYGADANAYPIPLPTINLNNQANLSNTPNLPLPPDAGNPSGLDVNGQPIVATVATADPAGALGSYTVTGAGPTHYPEMFGDVITVNGVAWPQYDVEPRQYRLRLLNGSDSRVYTLSFGGIPFWQIGTELGFLNRPVAAKTITIAPGERYDIVINFADVPTRTVARKKVRQLVVTNSAATPFPVGAPVTLGANTIMRFNVALPLAVTPLTKVDSGTVLRGLPVPAGVSPTPLLPAAVVPAGSTVRRIMLGEGADEYGRVTPLIGTYDPLDVLPLTPTGAPAPGATNIGTMRFSDPVTEVVTRGATGTATEVWEFWNTTVDAHPIHMHLVQFRILSRQGFGAAAGAAVNAVTASAVLEATTMSNGWSGVRLVPKNVALVGKPTPALAGEQGWKDTVLCYPGQVTRVLVTFNRPGKYVYHCHILSHEEHDMMRWFQVV